MPIELIALKIQRGSQHFAFLKYLIYMPEKKIVKIFIFDHASYLPNGNSPQRHYAFARELLKKDVQVTLIGSGFDHRSGRNIKFNGLNLWQSQVVNGVRYIWLRLPKYKGLKSRILNMILYPFLSILCYLTGYLGRPTCVVGSSPHLFAPLGANAVAFLARARFILEVRDLWPDSAVGVLGLSNKNPFVIAMRSVERYLFKSADRVISVLPGIEKYVKDKRFLLKYKTTWIPNGAELDLFSDIDISKNPVFGKITYFGAIGPANKTDMLLSVWAEVEKISNHLSLEIIGDGPSLAQLIVQCRELGLKTVQFYGFFSNKFELYTRASSAAAFILAVPNRNIYKYGVSMNKIPEYLALGRPLIYLGCGLDDSLASKPYVLSIDYEDNQKSALEIVEFMNHFNGQNKMTSDARIFVEEVYSYSKLAERFYYVCID